MGFEPPSSFLPLRMVHGRQFIFVLKALELVRFGVETMASSFTNLTLTSLGFSCLIDKLELV